MTLFKKKERIQLRLESALLADIDRWAAQHGIGRSAFIRAILGKAISSFERRASKQAHNGPEGIEQ